MLHSKKKEKMEENSFKSRFSSPIEWKISEDLVDYEHALTEMEKRVEKISRNEANECIWLLEHPPLYTAGTSAKTSDLLTPDRFPVFNAGRGGQYTYHGPGQRVAYVMLNLKNRKSDVRAFINCLEKWIIDTLYDFNIKGERREDRVGVWVSRPEVSLNREDKIAAIGVRLRKWVSFHGISINIDPELEHFNGIVPCGIQQHGVTSIVDLGHLISMSEFDIQLKKNFEVIFGL